MWIELLNGNSMLLQNHALKAVKSIKKRKTCCHVCEQCTLQICSTQNILHMTMKMYIDVGNFIFLFEQKVDCHFLPRLFKCVKSLQKN